MTDNYQIDCVVHYDGRFRSEGLKRCENEKTPLLSQITVFGGTQTRTNLDIDDICDYYLPILDGPDATISGEIFDTRSANHSIRDIARIKVDVTSAKIPAFAIGLPAAAVSPAPALA